MTRYTICHNDDDPADPNHRRVSIEIRRQSVNEWRIWCDGELADYPAFANESQAKDAIEQIWAGKSWALRREQQG